MRLLVPLLCLLSGSSCFAVLTLDASIRSSRDAWKAGAAREAKMREEHAREAALARAHYNEVMRDSPSAALAPPNVAISATPSTPPLVPVEPTRTPLRPR